MRSDAQLYRFDRIMIMKHVLIAELSDLILVIEVGIFFYSVDFNMNLSFFFLLTVPLSTVTTK